MKNTPLSRHLGLLSDQTETQGGLGGRRGAHRSSLSSLPPLLLASASGDQAPGPRQSSLVAAPFFLQKAWEAVGQPSYLKFCYCTDPGILKACSFRAPSALYFFSSPKSRELCFYPSASPLWGTSIPFPWFTRIK